MAPKPFAFTPDQLHQIEQLTANGYGATYISTVLFGSQARRGIIERCCNRNGWIRPNIMPARRRSVDEAKILALYADGIGVGGIAKQLDISPRPVERVLTEHGVTLRDRSLQQFACVGRRKRREAAGLPVTPRPSRGGWKLSHAALCRIAQSRGKRTGKAEDWLAEQLQQIGITFDRQAPIDIYNCDFLIDSQVGGRPIAVEVHGGYWHLYGEAFRRHLKRTRQILSTHHLVIIFAIAGKNTNPRLTIERGFEHLVTTLESLRGDPTTTSQYRVIWGDLGCTTFRSAQDDDFPLVNPLKCRRNPSTGRYESVS